MKYIQTPVRAVCSAVVEEGKELFEIFWKANSPWFPRDVEQAYQTAKEIATVLNAHDALVEACEAARKELYFWTEWNDHAHPEMDAALAMVDAALALVRGEADDA